MISLTAGYAKYLCYQSDFCYLENLTGYTKRDDYIFLNLDEVKSSIPLKKSYINDTAFDLATPVGHQESFSSGFWLSNVQAICEEIKTTGAVCLYIQTKDDFDTDLHPLINTKRYRTNYLFNLNHPLDVLMSNKKRDARQRLRRALKTISYTLSTDIVSEEFFSNYDRIARKNGFSLLYRFSFEQFNKMSDCEYIKYLELRQGDDFVAGGVFGFSNREVDYLYGANSEQYPDGVRLLIWEALQYFKQVGLVSMFIGGGVREDDSLAYFKQRLGPEEYPCRAVRAVLDTEKAELFSEKPITSEWFDGYFPPYKKTSG